MQKSKCPTCNSDVIVGEDAFEGDLLDCSNCGAELEIVTLHPPVLSETGNQRPAEDEDEYIE
jgi:lysine biosynthesis protein LysW